MALTSLTQWQNWLPILNGQLTDVFNERLENKVDASTGFEIFGAEDTKNYNTAVQLAPSIGGVQALTEGQDFPEVTGSQGYKKIYTTRRVGGVFRVSKEMYTFIADRYSEVSNLAEGLADDMMDKIDQTMADTLNNGWSTSYTDVLNTTVDATGPDGLALFSASHKTSSTGATFGNIIKSLTGGTNNPTFSRDALVGALYYGSIFKDAAGMLRPINFDTLVVGPDLYDSALRIVESQFIPGSNNNDINASVRGIKVIKWNRIGTGKWFVLDSKAAAKKTLLARFAQRPLLLPPERLVLNQSLVYAGDAMYHLAIGDPRYVRGSNGTNS